MALVTPNIKVTAVELVKHDILRAYLVPNNLVDELCAQGLLHIQRGGEGPSSHLSVEHRVLIRCVNFYLLFRPVHNRVVRCPQRLAQEDRMNLRLDRSEIYSTLVLAPQFKL
jgi:hypothetical protein